MAAEHDKGNGDLEQQGRSLPRRAVDRLRRLLGVQDLAADAGEAYRGTTADGTPAAGAAKQAQDLGALRVGSGALSMGDSAVGSVALRTEEAPEEEPWGGMGSAGGGAAGAGASGQASGADNGTASGGWVAEGGANHREPASLSSGGGGRGGGDPAPPPPLSSSGSTAGLATEDGQLIATGQIVAQGGWNAQVQPGTYQGKYGLLVVEPSGHWTYHLDNADPDVQQLNNGQQVQDHFQCMVVDGTGKQLPVPIVVGVSGTDDAAVISGARTGSVTEDLGPQQAAGQLMATDIDRGDQPSFVPQSVQGLYGTFDLKADGHWDYTVDPQKIQGLKAGEQRVETFDVSTTNAQKESVGAKVNIAIVGTDDKAIFPPVSLSVKEDDGTVTGHLVATDVDAEKLFYGPAPGTVPPAGIRVDPDGTVHVDPSQPAYQGLGAGEYRDLQIPVQVTDERGVAVQSLLTVRVEGTNDAPVVTVRPPVPVDEGSGVHTTQVLATDVDATDTLSYGLPAGAPMPPGVRLDQTTGQIGIDTNNPAYNHLGVGEVQTVMVPVVVSDGHGGTTNTQVAFEVHGTNDAPVLAAIAQRTATEGDAPINGQLQATDADTNDRLSYGLPPGISAPAGFTLQGDGHWAFDPQNPAYDHLRAGDHQQLLIPLQVSDGHGGVSQQNLAITVTGTNDGAVIGGTSTGAVKEDQTLQAAGVLTVADPDAGEAQFKPAVLKGLYGELHVNADGSWSYTLDNTNPKVQALPAGGSMTDHLLVLSADGTAHQLRIQINGTDDAAQISGTSTGQVREDAVMAASGQLSVRDIDQGETPQFQSETLQGIYGQLSIDASGQWHYQLDPAVSQQLQDGVKARESFTVLASDGKGHQVSQQVLVDITGTNDAARISGTATGQVSEDTLLKAGGKLDVQDVDRGEAHFQAGDQTGNYGSLHLDADGTWQYTLNNSSPSVQQLPAGASATETFTVLSADGTTHQVAVQIAGQNDVARISGTTTGQVSEDTLLKAGGKLDVQDADRGEAHFQAGDQTGSYGSLHLDADGTWQYTLNNTSPRVQELPAGASATETFTVCSADGTTHQLSVQIAGTNDAARISGTATGQVKEDTLLQASGKLDVQDVDRGEAHFQAGDQAGIYGSLHLDADGTWQYTLNNASAKVQELSAGASATETFTVRSADGTTHQLNVQIAGTNDAARISGTDSGRIKEDVNVHTISPGSAFEVRELNLSGALTISDTDGPAQNAFQYGPGSGHRIQDPFGGRLNIDHYGGWEYFVDNKNPALQRLNEGETREVIYEVRSIDGTPHRITITVTGTNDAPVLSVIPQETAAEDGAPVSGQLNATDVDSGDTLSYGIVAGTQLPAGLTIQANGSWSFDPKDPAYNSLKDGQQQQVIAYLQVSDGHGGTSQQTLTINLTGTNDAARISGTATGQVSEDTLLKAGGKLDVQDVDRGEAHFQAGDQTGSYGSLHLDADGTWQYTLNNSSPSVQQLPAGASATETFTVCSADGTTHQVAVQIAGHNDVARISGTTTGQVKEDTLLKAGGKLDVQDVDRGEAHFQAGDQTGVYGSLHLDADGTWQYTLNNASAKVQEIQGGAARSETFTVHSADGTTQQIRVLIRGQEDAAQISGTSTGTVTEDGTLQATGRLQVSDVDRNQSRFDLYDLGDKVGTYGTFHLNIDGTWTYQLNNSAKAVQDLQAGDIRQDSFTVHSLDGTSHEVHMTVVGTSDAPVLTAGQITGGREDNSIKLTEAQILQALQARDPDGDHLSVANVAYSGSDATLVHNSDGTWTLTPHANWAGDLNLQVGVSDGHDTTTGTLTVPIAAVADKVTMTVAPSLSSTFEDPTLGSQAFHFADPTQWGWHTDNASGLVEQGKGETYGDPNHANTGLIELEGNAGERDNLYRVLDTQPGAAYHFSLDVSGRVGVTTPDGAAVQVLWEGKVIDTIYPAANTFGFVRHEYDLTAHTSNPRIEFRALTHDGSGPIVDNPRFEFRGFNGTEDTPLPIKLSVETADKDGSETVSAGIKGLPAGFVISDGTPGHQSTSTGVAQLMDMQGWDLQHMQVTPPANFHGQVQAVLVATSTEASNHDQSSTEIPVPLNFAGVNDNPTVQISAGTALQEGSAAASREIVSGSDVDGDTTGIDPAWLTANGWTSGDHGVSYTKPGTYGSATLTVASGQVSYQLNNAIGGAADQLSEGQNGRDQFQVQINDGHGGTALGTAIFNVQGTNDAPVVTAGTATPLAEGSTGTATSILTMRDPDSSDPTPTVDEAWLQSHGWSTGDHGSTYTKAGTYGSATLNIHTSTVSYQLDNRAGGATDQLAEGQRVHDDFGIQVVDSHGATAMATPSFGVSGTNDAPEVSASNPSLASATEDKDGASTPVVYTEADLLTLIGASDQDAGDTLHITAITAPPGFGTFAKLANGDWQFTPPADKHQAGLSVSITVEDSHHQSTTGHALLDVLSATDSGAASLVVTSAAQVMQFNSAGEHAFKNTGSGPLSAFSLEVMAVGDPANRGTTTGNTGQVLFNLATASNSNVLSLWRPAALSIAFGGSDHATSPPLDITSGQHRLTLTWDKDSGVLTLYDNGKVYQHWPPVNKGIDIPAGTIVTVGQKMNDPTHQSGFNADEQFHGALFNVTMANQKVGPTDVQVPLANHLSSSQLVLDLRHASGTVVDTLAGPSTPHLTVTSVGTATMQVSTVASAPPAGATLNLSLVMTPPADHSDPITRELLRGLPPGTVLSDGAGHSHTVPANGEVSVMTDLSGWQHLDQLTAQLPSGYHQNLPLQLVVETTGPDQAVSRASSDASVLFDPSASMPSLPPLPTPAVAVAPPSPPPPPPVAADAAMDPAASPQLIDLMHQLHQAGLDVSPTQAPSHRSATDPASGAQTDVLEIHTAHGAVVQSWTTEADGSTQIHLDTSGLDRQAQAALPAQGGSADALQQHDPVEPAPVLSDGADLPSASVTLDPLALQDAAHALASAAPPPVDADAANPSSPDPSSDPSLDAAQLHEAAQQLSASPASGDPDLGADQSSSNSNSNGPDTEAIPISVGTDPFSTAMPTAMPAAETADLPPPPPEVQQDQNQDLLSSL